MCEVDTFWRYGVVNKYDIERGGKTAPSVYSYTLPYSAVCSIIRKKNVVDNERMINNKEK